MSKSAKSISLDLTSFFPYRLSRLYDAVSRSVSQVYSERFDLSRQQWRVLAILGQVHAMTAKDIAMESQLDKMQVSRAVSQLEKAGHLSRKTDAADKRHHQLSLTKSGHQLYKKVIPLVLARESFLLAALNTQEQEQLGHMMEKLLQRSEELQSYG